MNGGTATLPSFPNGNGMNFFSPLNVTSSQPFETADSKFQYAIQLLQESWNSKVQNLQEDNTRWKTVFQDQVKKISSLEGDLQRANERNDLLQRQIDDLMNERKREMEAKLDLQRKYDALKRKTLELQNLKQSIAEMVESGDNGEFLVDESLLTNKRDMISPPSHNGFGSGGTTGSGFGGHHLPMGTSLGSSRLTASSPLRFPSRSQTSQPDAKRQGAPPPPPPSSSSANVMKFELNQQQKSPPNSETMDNNSERLNERPITTPLHTKRGTETLAPQMSSAASPSDLKVIAHQLYKEVRDVLGKDDFERFVQIINRLNRGELTTDHAMDQIQKILKVSSLLERLRKLIEAARESQ